MVFNYQVVCLKADPVKLSALFGGVLLLLWIISFTPATAQETRMTIRHLVKTSSTYTMARALPPADYVSANCYSEDFNFSPTSRSLDFAGSEGVRTEPYSEPVCGYPSGVDLTRRIGRFNSTTLRDLGVHTVRCTNIEIRQPPYLTDTISRTGSAFSCPPPLRLIAGGVTQYFDDFVYEIEVYNDPPRASIGHTGTGLLAGVELAHDAAIEIAANASDPDGGTPTVSWAITDRPIGSISNLTTSSGDIARIAFAGEQDFGDWTFQATMIDNEGERVRRSYSLSVVNQTPTPLISDRRTPGASTDRMRVPFGEPIQLTATPDEDGGDYTSVRWDVVTPGSDAWAPAGDTLNIDVPTTLSSIGEWRFRVTVTDNEDPALTGTSGEFIVEVYNAPPELTLEPVTSPVIAEGGSFVLRASAVDPDGGDVEISVHAVQTPDSSGVAPGTLVARQSNMLDYVQPLSISDAGTWIFEVVARDDEAAPFAGESDPIEAIIVADGFPEAEIDGPTRVGSLTGMVSLSGVESLDPDTPCVDAPGNCHSTADGSTPRGITPGITRYVWTLIDASLDSGEAFPTGDAREIFTIRGPNDAIEVPLEEMLPGLFIFQLEVEDGEGNVDYKTHRVEVIEEQTNPLAIVSPPSRHIVSVTEGVTSPIILSGDLSFDPDNLLTGDLPGIEGYAWSVEYEPADCVGRRAASETSAIFSLWALGSFFPPECIGPYKVTLTVTDDDEPTAHEGRASTAVIIGNCGLQICIDLPTKQIPYKVEFADDTDVLIFYHVDPTVAALYPHGSSAVLRIYHSSDTVTPIFKSHSPNVGSGPLESLLVFHWDGNWLNSRPRPGRYNIEIELLDHNLASASPAVKDYETNAITLEVDELEIPDSAMAFAARQSLVDESLMIDIPFTIDGAIVPDRLSWKLFDPGGSEIFTRDLPPALSGNVRWDGRVNENTDREISVAALGAYEIEVEAFRGSASLTGPVRHALTVYRLVTEPLTGAADDWTVMANTDDDNLNGQPDNADTGPVSGETDLLGARLIMEPAVEGMFRISTTDATARFALNDSATRAAATTTLPATYALAAGATPPEVYIEGLSGGDANLRLEFIPDGATTTLPPSDHSLRIIEMGVDGIDNFGSYAAVNSVDIAQMANAYDNVAPYGLRNSSGNNFVDRDDDRFVLRVTDAGANADPSAPDSAEVELLTINADGSTDDNATPVLLRETSGSGASANASGIFQSHFQIAVTQDLSLADPDDDIAAFDGVGGVTADDTRGDRTHRATIDGGMRFRYRPVDSTRVLSHQTPICGRAPEQRRVVDIRARIFIDPTTGTPAAPQSYVTDQIERANIAWAPACLRFRLISPPTTISPANTPMVPTATGMDNMLHNMGNYDHSDRSALVAQFAPSASIDVFELFIVPNYSGANAVTYGPFDQIPALGSKTFMVMGAGISINSRTLAHELGHALGNTADSHNPTHIFYPAEGHNGASPPPIYPYVIFDNQVTNYRRITDTIINQSKTTRAPGAPPRAIGNNALKVP